MARAPLGRVVPLLLLAALARAGEESARVDRETGEARLDLAQWCARAGLDDAAREEAREALARLGESPEAREILDAPRAPGAPSSGAAADLARRREALVRREVSLRVRLGRTLERSGDEADLVRQLSILHGIAPDDDDVASFARRCDARHERWDNAYVATSDHFRLRANIPWAELRGILDRLEDLYRRVSDSCPVEGLLREPEGLLEVAYFATEADFLRHLREAHPDIPSAPPFFDASDRMTHIYPQGNQVATTTHEILLHEATHHILYARLGTGDPCAGRPHFWASEGIACHSEILASDATGLRARRMREMAAQGNHAPLDAFVRFTQNEINGPDALSHYAQAQSLAGWLLTADDGKRREPFWRYLAEVESGRADEGSWDRHFGDPPSAVEAAWLAAAAR